MTFKMFTRIPPTHLCAAVASFALVACTSGDDSVSSDSATEGSVSVSASTAGTTGASASASASATATAGTTMSGSGSMSASSTGTTSDTSESDTDATTTESTGVVTDSTTTNSTDSTTDPTTTTTTDTTDSSTTDPTGGPMCGDLVVDPGEECDDGNQDPGDGCEPDCTLTPPPDNCGNGQIDDPEQCDGDNLPLTDCTEFNDAYSGGTLSCAANCSYDTSACEKCEAPGDPTPCDSVDDDLLHSIELNCQTAGMMWADPNKHVPVTNYALMSPDPTAWRVIKQFGTYLDPNDNNQPLWRPKAGEKMLIIGSGKFPMPNAGVLTQNGGTISGVNLNPDNQNKLPGVMTHLRGSNNGNGGTPFMNCDLVKDCSDTLYSQWTLGSGANDVLHFTFDLKVPKGVYGYVVDFAYFSSEYPSWVDTSFNDMAVIWTTSESYTGNASFITDNNNNPQPLSVTALANNGLLKYTGNSPALTNTGFVGNGGSGWASVKGSTKPEEDFSLSFAVMDLSDTILDTVLLIDNWRWDCKGCVPSEVDSCGVAPQ